MTVGHTELRLVAPDEPPRLTPGAAEALLKILLRARSRLAEERMSEEEEDER